MECETSDVKPDLKPDLAASTSEAASRPGAASASSSPEAQRNIPSRMVRWGTPVVTPQPPPMRPRNTILRMHREAAAARFNEMLGGRAAERQSEVVAAVSVADSSSDDETCDLSDLSELSLSNGDESDNDNNCISVSIFGERSSLAPVTSTSVSSAKGRNQHASPTATATSAYYAR